MPKDNNFTITLEKFSDGLSPLAFTDALTEVGSRGNASAMQNVDILDGKLKQGPGLADLTNGNEAGVVDQLIQFVMDRATASDVTYALGTTKLFKLSSTTVTSGGSPSFPQTVTGMTEGESLVLLKGNLYGFHNKASGGDIFKMPLSTEVIDNDWGSTTPTGAAALEKAPHPADKKEDIMLFGNGRYVGVYFDSTTTINVQKLDFGNDAEVGDVLYHAGLWYIAVNSGITGTNRTEGQIYLYDGSAVPSTLEDETAVGMQRIGFLYRINGIVYVAYQDLSTSGFIIGYINGRRIEPLKRFSGTLPTFNQKTLYKNTILFLSSNLVYSAGSFVEGLPFQLSQHAPGGHETVGAIAAPFGTPLVSSEESEDFTAAVSNTITSTGHGLSDDDTILLTTTDTLPAGLSTATTYYVISATTDTFEVSTSQGGAAVDITDTGTGTHTWHRYRLAKFSGYETDCQWESIVIPVSNGKMLGMIDEIIVQTNTLGASARCDLTFGYDQDSSDSNTKQITTTGKRRHYFDTFGVNGIEDFKLKLDWSNGSSSNNVEIRKIIIKGHFISST